MYVTPAWDTFRSSVAIETAPAGRRRHSVWLQAGDHLYFEGDEVSHLYQVEHGVLRLSRLLEDGRRQVIAFGYPGDVIGFPHEGEHHADCHALTRAKLTGYRRALLDDPQIEPELHQRLLRAALREISDMQDHFMMLGRKSSLEKLCSFLHVLARRAGRLTGKRVRLPLPMSRADIADFLGLTTETVSRGFTQLRKAEIITLETAQQVVITRPDRLSALARGTETSL